jgi:putative copper resistance protein D
MQLFVDLFGYLTIVVHGLVILFQSAAIGSAVFLAVAVPQALSDGQGVREARAAAARLGAWSALALALAEAVTVAMQAALLAGTADLPLLTALGAFSALAGIGKAAASLAIAALLFRRGEIAPRGMLIGLGLIVLACATMTTHAIARLDDRAVLAAAAFLHQLGAAIWIGGIPAFLIALARIRDPGLVRRIASRFSRISMAGVAAILASGLAMSLFYIANVPGIYGTAYGIMVSAKVLMFGMLLLLGLGNLLLTERLRRDPATPVLRMRRFAEVELGLGIAIFFTAASLTSVPPAVDLPVDRVSWQEIVARNTPEWPRLRSPDHATLALSQLQSQLDAEAARRQVSAAAAFDPGSGDLPPRNAEDIAWSEYNHHWAGIAVLLIGVLALLNQAGLREARNWPLVFLALAAFLFLRADPEVWPLGDEGLLESLRDVEVLQHRMFVLVIIGFALFEWRVRRRALREGWMPLVFPLASVAGGILLFTHSHAIANVKDQVLIELSHTPLALAALIAGWARWLELRLDPVVNRRAVAAAAWVWPVCLGLIGLILLLYRES